MIRRPCAVDAVPDRPARLRLLGEEVPVGADPAEHVAGGEAVFVVILAFQIVVLVLVRGEVGPDYWLIAGAVALGWVACVWVGSRARGILQR